MVLPADVRAGSHWNGAGSAGDTLDYRSELRAEASGGDCLSVEGEVRYLSKEGELGRVVTVSQTWCRSEGIVAESQSFADIRTASSRIDPPVPSVQTTTNAPIRWTMPERWTSKSMSTISINPTFGQDPMVGSPSPASYASADRVWPDHQAYHRERRPGRHDSQNTHSSGLRSGGRIRAAQC